jgi:hypothetical protein
LVLFPTYEYELPFVFKSRQNKSPFANALGDWFPFRTYFLTSKASPNDRGIIVIVIIIIVDEAKQVLHDGGIIAQRFYLSGVFFSREWITWWASQNRSHRNHQVQ